MSIVNTLSLESNRQIKINFDDKNEFLNSTAQWNDGIHSRTVDIYSFI